MFQNEQGNRVAWLSALLLVALATTLAHLPSLDGDILGWDDRRALVENTAWQGLSPATLRYAFTTTDMAMYRPLTWLSYSVDHALSGMSAFGFHRTNLALHVAVALLLVAVIRRWLALLGRAAWFWPSVLSGLAFSLHPLRVQVSAWLSARADALAALFLLVATLSWFAYLERGTRGARVGWHVAFAASLLAKPVALLAPVAWWMAGRWGGTQRGIQRAARRDAWLGLALSAAVSVPLLMAKSVAGMDRGGVPQLPAWAALTAPHNAVFPLWKTLWPTSLGFYEPAHPLDLLHPAYVAGTLAAAALAAVAFQLRHRHAGIAVTLASHVLLLAPVLGVLPFGYELVADRFSYVPALVLSVSAATAAGALRGRAAWMTGSACCAWLCVMGSLSWQQAHVWQSNSSWWTHNVTIHPDSGMAHAGMGDLMLSQGRITEARAHYQRTRELQPDYVLVNLGLGFIDLAEGRPRDAIEKLEKYLRVRPANRDAREYIMHAYAAAGRMREARAVHEMLQREDASARASHRGR